MMAAFLRIIQKENADFDFAATQLIMFNPHVP